MRKHIEDVIDEITAQEVVIEVNPIIEETTDLPISDDLPISQGTTNWNTTTTTIFTPGNTKMDEAMAVKSVADELLAATGTVVGATLALALYAPLSVSSSAKFGEKVGRGLGNWMYYSLG